MLWRMSADPCRGRIGTMFVRFPSVVSTGRRDLLSTISSLLSREGLSARSRRQKSVAEIAEIPGVAPRGAVETTGSRSSRYTRCKTTLGDLHAMRVRSARSLGGPKPMASVASFYFAMFKRFQAICGTGSGHVNPDSAPASTLYGGFSLYSTQDPQGSFGQLGTQATTWNLAQGMRPLNPLSNDPTLNPLWVMLNTSLGPAPQPATVVVNGQTWPTMPPPPEDEFTIWLAANATTPRLIDAFGDWITAGKVDDSPQDAPLSYAALKQAKPAPWPLKNQEYTSVLFVASMPGDDGRRHGDLSMPDPPVSHVPANFWATSQIFLTWPPGVPGQSAGKIANPASLKPKDEYWVVALVGNAGGDSTGVTANVNSPKCTLLGDAQCFNTFTSPGAPLPSLDNIDPASTNPTYEALYMAGGSYDVAGFRFNVDAVFSQLATVLAAQVPPAMLGGLQPADWLRDGHPCVKVRVMAGEQLDHFPP